MKKSLHCFTSNTNTVMYTIIRYNNDNLFMMLATVEQQQLDYLAAFIA
jgi:hypothetical protein